jgi:hypothetical protein
MKLIAALIPTLAAGLISNDPLALRNKGRMTRQLPKVRKKA